MKKLIMHSRLLSILAATLALEVCASAATLTFANATAITIPAITTERIASPYPSNISVVGVSGPITKVTVSLFGLTHTFPDDIDILLVGPAGQNILLMSDTGSAFDVTGINLVFDDAAANFLPDAAQIVSGTFKPTNIGAGDAFPAPAPVPSGSSLLSLFNGTNANGTWSLYVFDDLGGDIGSVSGGWDLTITDDAITGVIPEPTTALLLGAGLIALVAARARREPRC